MKLGFDACYVSSCGDTFASILPSMYSRYGCSSISGIRRNSSSVIVLLTPAGLAIVEPLSKADDEGYGPSDAVVLDLRVEHGTDTLQCTPPDART